MGEKMNAATIVYGVCTEERFERLAHARLGKRFIKFIEFQRPKCRDKQIKL